MADKVRGLDIERILPWFNEHVAKAGSLTGTIIGMAQALGETAPLLMIGMVAFIVDVPSGFTDPATALPVQIFLWADSPERAFVEKTAAAVMVLGSSIGIETSASPGPGTNGSKYRLRTGFCSLATALASICRTRSRVTLKMRPTSSRV